MIRTMKTRKWTKIVSIERTTGNGYVTGGLVSTYIIISLPIDSQLSHSSVVDCLIYQSFYQGVNETARLNHSQPKSRVHHLGP